VNYAKLLEINSFFTWHIFLEVGKTQDIPSKIWQTLGDTLRTVKSPASISVMVLPKLLYNCVILLPTGVQYGRGVLWSMSVKHIYSFESMFITHGY